MDCLVLPGGAPRDLEALRREFLQWVSSCCVFFLRSVQRLAVLFSYPDKDVSIHPVPPPALELAPSPRDSPLPLCSFLAKNVGLDV